MKTKYYLCKTKETKYSKSNKAMAIVKERKHNPQLKTAPLNDGRESLYLEYYLGREQEPVLDKAGNPVYYTTGKMAGKPKYKVTHKRKKEALNLYLITKPRTPIERQMNRDTQELAEQIRNEKERQFLEDKEGYKFKRERQINFLDYFQAYIDRYTKKDIRMLKIAFSRFNDFLKDTPEYSKFVGRITPDQLTREMMITFTEYLQTRSRGEGARTLFARFKKVVKYAVEHGDMKKNPCQGIVIKIDDTILRKEVLSTDEVLQLINTKGYRENPNIRRAFIFCLYTGMRFCDVKDLTFAAVDYSNRLLKFEQNKTKGHSASSGVTIPLNDFLLQLIGEPAEGAGKDAVIFPLPSYWMCIKALRHWTKRAGIDKHITWHCARHSFAVNILGSGANIKTVASLLGHSGLEHTEKYTRAVDSLKQEAINSLPVAEL